MRLRQRHAAVREAQACQRVRRDHVDALGDLEARRAGFDDEGRDAARARRFAAAGEDDVEVGDAAVGDPGLLAVEHRMVAVDARARIACAATSLAGLGLGQREGGDRLAARHARQPALLAASGVPASEIAPRAQALHREREVGQAGVAGQHLARRHSVRVSIASAARRRARAGDRMAQPAGVAELCAPGAGTARRRRCRARRAPRCAAQVIERRARSARCRASKNGQRGGRGIAHQLPSNTGLVLATNAR